MALRAAHEVTPYAGGTDLMIDENREGAYLFLNKVPELKQVVSEGGVLRFGAGCTFSELLAHPSTPAILKEALSLIAAPAIRNEGTIGGNIGTAVQKRTVRSSFSLRMLNDFLACQLWLHVFAMVTGV